MEPVVFTVPGLPVAWGRPHYSRSQGRFFTPAKTRQAERSIAQWAAEAMGDRPLYDVPVEVRIVAVFAPPKTRTKAQRAMPWADFRGSRPDLDNVVKAITDACNSVVYTDDALIAALHAAKVFGERPCVRVIVTPLHQWSWPVGDRTALPAHPDVPVTPPGLPPKQQALALEGRAK